MLKILSFEKPNIFKYDKKALKMENLCYIEYNMKNIGKTEINDIGVTVNLPRNVALIEFGHKNSLIENEMLSYDGWIRKNFIKPGETFIFRIYYVKDQVMISNLGNPIITFWLEDIKHFVWGASLVCPR